jgi:ribosomal protein S18 acetylase RimI-like enzyme
MTRLARAIETDRRYFELGARIDALPGAELAWTPGFSALPAGAVVQRVDPAIATLGDRWFTEIERALIDIGARTVRIYLDEPMPCDLFRRAGYEQRDELFFASPLRPEPTPGLTLRPVTSEGDWRHKLLFHEAAGATPDGHPNLISDWVALERIKCDHGMEAYLVEADGQKVGAIGAIWGDDLLRIKNVIVHPDHRRRSIGRRMLDLMAALGRSRGVSEQCLIALPGGAGERLYRSAGMELIGTQVEWSKWIGNR